MSKANLAANAMRAADLPAVPEAARRLAALAAETLASVVTACAVRRAYRGLAALDDRLLADIGLDRATVENLAANSQRETWTSLAQVPWHRSHTSA
jgi:uncharacterized protein YjiS (DUF1127 family)